MTGTNPAAGVLSDLDRALQDANIHPTDARLIREAAEREVARVTAAVEALADEWESWADGRSTPRIDAFRDAAERLRAALSSADTGALDRERAKAWDEGVRYAWDDPEPYDLRHNPYRAAGVSPEGG